ncbi:hypothetical protein MBANPS3_005503 [Mucor bainieri]
MSNLHNNPHLELPPPPQPSSPHRPSPQQQQQQQQQQYIASVYPKLPSQDDLPPSYSVASPSYTNMPQAPYPQYSPHQQQQQPSYPYPQYQTSPAPAQQNQQPSNGPRPPVMYYGSMAPPNTTHPLPPSQQQQVQAQAQSQHTVQSITALRTSSELVQCPHCQQLVYTVLDYDSGLCTGLTLPIIAPHAKKRLQHLQDLKETQELLQPQLDYNFI